MSNRNLHKNESSMEINDDLWAKVNCFRFSLSLTRLLADGDGDVCDGDTNEATIFVGENSYSSSDSTKALVHAREMEMERERGRNAQQTKII